jgi:hypothetical protein
LYILNVKCQKGFDDRTIEAGGKGKKLMITLHDDLDDLDDLKSTSDEGRASRAKHSVLR